MEPAEESERFVALFEQRLAGAEVADTARAQATSLLSHVLPARLRAPGDISQEGRRLAMLQEVAEGYALLSEDMLASTVEALEVMRRLPGVIREFCADGDLPAQPRAKGLDDELVELLRSGFEILCVVEQATLTRQPTADVRAKACRWVVGEIARERVWHLSEPGFACRLEGPAALHSMLIRDLAFVMASAWRDGVVVPSSEDVRGYAEGFGFAHAPEPSPAVAGRVGQVEDRGRSSPAGSRAAARRRKRLLRYARPAGW